MPLQPIVILLPTDNYNEAARIFRGLPHHQKKEALDNYQGSFFGLSQAIIGEFEIEGDPTHEWLKMEDPAMRDSFMAIEMYAAERVIADAVAKRLSANDMSVLSNAMIETWKSPANPGYEKNPEYFNRLSDLTRAAWERHGLDLIRPK